MGNIFSLFGSTKPETKVILITGASSGMGKESALTLVKRGHIVFGAARRVDKMQEIVQAGGHVVQMDVTDEKQIVQAVSHIIKEQGRIDVLVNNAGYGLMGAIEDVSMDDARHQFDVNLFGLARLTTEVVPHMRNQGKGTIINISSVGGKIYMPFFGWYHAAKHALEGWSDCLRLELSPFNIKVVIVEPGGIKSEFAEVATEAGTGRSKGSLYGQSIEKYLESAKGRASHYSPPSVIADVIVKASETTHPKRRYVAGAFARQLLFVRSWFGDAVFDLLMLRAFRN